MVATRGQRSKQPAQEEEEAQPQKTDYERRRDRRVEENRMKMQAMGLHTLAADFNNSLPQPQSTKGGKSANKNTNSSDSETSEYLLDDDQGDSDDDDSESDEQPQYLAIEYPPIGRRKIISSKKKINPNMAPGSRSKRVRASEQSDVQASGAQTRSSKRVHSAERDGDNVLDDSNAHDDIPDSYTTPGPADHDRTFAHAEEDSGAAGLDSTAAGQDNTAADVDIVAQEEGTTGPAPRKPRQRTKGKQLDKMTKAMGRRLPIVVEAGKTRPHDPVQAAKFASEAGLIVRECVPILPHWKDYKKNNKYYDKFKGDLSGRLAIKDKDTPTEEACTAMLRSAVKNQRYRLKQKYFNGVPANEVRTTSPVSYMTDEEWRALVAKWSDPKNMETCEKNKQNRSKVKFHQATGSRCYVAHLHAYKQKRIREEPSADLTEELDAVEAFQTCHTSSKKGLTEPAREALLQMEALRSEPVADGLTAPSSVEVVSKVLSQNSSHHFLKSVGINKPASSKSSSANESELREQLAAEATAAVQGELDELKKKTQDAEEQLLRTQIELEEYKKQTERNTKEMQENNALLKKLLSFHANASSST